MEPALRRLSASLTSFLCISCMDNNETTKKNIKSVCDSNRLAGTLKYLWLTLRLILNLLLGLVEEGLVLSEIGHDVLGEVVLDHCEIGDHWVDLLRSCLSGHHSELVLLFGHRPAVLGDGVGLGSDVQFGDLSAAGLVGERLTPFELLLEAVLVEVLELLQSLSDAVRLPGDFWLINLFDLLWFLLLASWIGQIIETLVIWLRIALQLHFPLDDFFEILHVILRLMLF